MGSFSGQFSRPLPGPPWGVENGVRARLGACRFLLDAVRSWVQFGLEPSCQGPWIVAVEHVTQSLSFILDGSLPGGPPSIHIEEGREPVVDLLHDRCAGLDVSKKDVKACVRSPGARANQRHTEVRTFATTTNALLQLRDWLIEQGVTLIAIEATGDYWRPPFYVLCLLYTSDAAD